MSIDQDDQISWRELIRSQYWPIFYYSTLGIIIAMLLIGFYNKGYGDGYNYVLNWQKDHFIVCNEFYPIINDQSNNISDVRINLSEELIDLLEE